MYGWSNSPFAQLSTNVDGAMIIPRAAPRRINVHTVAMAVNVLPNPISSAKIAPENDAVVLLLRPVPCFFDFVGGFVIKSSSSSSLSSSSSSLAFSIGKDVEECESIVPSSLAIRNCAPST